MEESVFYSKDVSPPYHLHDHKGVQSEEILNDGCLEECHLHQQGSSLPTDRVASTQRAGNDPSLDCGLTDGNHESSARKIRVQEDHASCKNKNQSQDDGAALPQTQQQQNFHHPHFNHHRRRQRSSGHTGAYSVRRSPRSLSVNEGEDQISHTHSQGARSPAKSSHSLDHSSVWPDNGLPQSASPGKRNKAVTDLDQAMLERDEMKLRSLCGDRMNNISFGYIPNSYGSAAGCIDLETETNLDDDPVNVKYVSTINVARQKCLASGEVEAAIRLDEKYIHSIILDEVVKFPVEMPPKLHFSHSEVFDGQLLLHWLASHFDSSHYLSLILTKHDIVVLISQFCTHLLAAGVLSPIQGQQSLREHVFKPNGRYYWTKQDPSPVQADVPGRLQPMWPPTQGEADDEAKPLLKYTEAEHQAAMVLMRRDYNQEVDRLQKEHAEELDRVHSDYHIRLEDLRAEVRRLEQEVEKCKQLASLDRLTQTALSHAQAAQNEAGLAETDEKGSYMHGKNHAVIGTPQTGEQKSYHSQVATPECVTVNFSHSKKDSPTVMPPLKTPVELTAAGYMQEYDHPYATDSDSATSVSPPVPPPPPPPPPTAGLPPPPPPPPPPGMGRAVPPPPPPLGGPPASGFVVSLRRTPSKPIISPRSPMKPLFWKRIQVHTLKQESAAERIFFWETIEEAKVDMEEFDDLFSKVSMVPVKKSATKPKANAKKQAAKVIDAKRSQAVGILLSTTRLDMSEIEHAILHLDTSLLDIEKFKAIYENRPSPEEIRLIKKQLDCHPDVPLDKPEQFLYDLHQIPGCANRIFCFIFQSTFQENISVIENKLNNLKMTCEMLMEGPQIKNIFGLILALGNYMNGGSRTRGQADGFELEILPKLKDYKGKDNRTCLLQYLVMQYVRNFEKDDAGTERVKLPVPDPSDIVQAGLVSFEDMEKELTRIRRDFDLAEARAAEVIRTATEDNKEPFDSLMQAFFQKGRNDMADGEEMLKTVSERFYQMVNFFCVKPKEGEEFVKPEYFFSLWLSFCQNFKDYWKREQQRIVKLRLREVENRLRKIQESKKAVQTRAKTAGGLKDRLSKLSKK